MNQIQLTNKMTATIILALMLITGISGMIGYTIGLNKAFRYHEIGDSTGGQWMAVPDNWNLIPVPDGYGRIYKRPTDQEG